MGKEAVVSLADNQIITGNVDSSSATAGTLEFLGTGKVTGDIGKTNALTRLKFSGAGDITLPKANVKIYEIANADAKVTANDTLKGNILFSSDGRLFASKGITGNITTNIDNTGSITICGGDVGTIGEEYKKLKQVNLNQASDSSVRKLYSANLNVSDKDSIIFHDNIRANNIDIKNSNIEISDNISIYGNINASNSSILLDNNILILSGTNTFANQITISSTYDALHLSGGSIIIPTGATLDLSNVSNLIIKLSLINSDISKINEGTRYSIILTEDGSNIILLSNPENQVQLDNSPYANKLF